MCSQNIDNSARLSAYYKLISMIVIARKGIKGFVLLDSTIHLLDGDYVISGKPRGYVKRVGKGLGLLVFGTVKIPR